MTTLFGNRRAGVLLASALLVATAGCGDPKELIDKVASAEASQRKQQEPPPEPSATRPTSMPELLVDSLGALLGGKRVREPASEKGRVELREVVKNLPVNDNPVTVRVEKNAKTPHVAAVVDAFGEAGAPKVVVQSEGRPDVPKELRLTPRSKAPKPPECAIVASVTEDLDTGDWPVKGGGGARHRKGWAGPDMTNTAKTLEDRLEQCDARVAYFSANAKYDWQLAFNLGGTIVVSDKQHKIENLVLLGDEPVAGRRLELETKK
jgi:hypothetical protein